MTLFGPVFHSDLVVQARRPRTYVIRTAVLSLLLVGFVATYFYNGHHFRPFSTRAAAEFGRQLYLTSASIELILVLILSPIAAAGALVNDRTRGTLQHTFLTDLTNREIVYGRWASRTFPLLVLIAATFPIQWLCMLLGGISPADVLKLYVVLFGCASLSTSLCMFLSLRARSTGDVLILCLTAMALWSLSPLIPRIANPRPSVLNWGDFLSPFGWVFVVSASFSPRTTPLVAASLALATMALLEWTTLRIRSTTSFEKLLKGGLARKRRRFEPDLDTKPVEWLEWARNRGSLSRSIMLLMLISLCGVALAAVPMTDGTRGVNSRIAVPVVSIAFGLTSALFFGSIAAASSISDDRTNRHFEMLGATLLSPREVMNGRYAAESRRDAIALAFCIGYGVVCAPRSPQEGFLCGTGLAASYVGFSSLFRSIAVWSALTFRRQLTCLGITAAAFLFLAMGWPSLFVLSGQPNPLLWGAIQTGPFFSFAFLAVRAAAPAEQLAGTEVGNLVWTFVCAGVCLVAARRIDIRSRRLIELRMRGEP